MAVEKAGLVAVVVAAVLVLLAMSGVWGRQITDGISELLSRLFDAVPAIDCAAATAEDPWAPDHPCVTASSASGHSLGLDLGVVELEDGLQALIEERSDGTVAVTIADEGSVGAEAGIGGHGEVYWGDRVVGFSAEAGVGAAIGGHLGETWTFDDTAEARKFVEDVNYEYAADKAPEPAGWIAENVRDVWHAVTGREDPEGSLESEQVQLGLVSEAEAGASLDGAHAGAESVLEGAVAASRNVNGELTATMLVDAELAAGAGIPTFADLGGGATGESAVSVTWDDDGELIAMETAVDLAVDGEMDFDGQLGEVVGYAEPDAGDQRLSIQQSIDLSDPTTTAAADEVLGAVAELNTIDHVEDLDELPDLDGPGDRLDQHTTTTAQRWEEDDGRYGASASAGVVAEVGGSFEVTTTESTLVEARYWDRDAQEWATWDDCFG